MSDAYERYLALEKRMLEVRAAANGTPSRQEDQLLDVMDVIWRQLTDEEIEKLDNRD